MVIVCKLKLYISDSYMYQSFGSRPVICKLFFENILFKQLISQSIWYGYVIQPYIFWWLKLLKKMMSLLCMTIERAKATLDCDSMLCFFAFFLQMAYDDFLIIFWPRTNFYYCNLFPIHLMRYAVGLFWFSFQCCTIVDKRRNFKALTYILHTNHGDA